MKTLKISTLVASVVAASALAGSAFAGQMNQDQNNFVNVGVNGAYTAFSKADLGNSNSVKGQVPITYAQSNNKSKSVGYGATLGYEYALVPSFRIGAELGYENLGKYTTRVRQSSSLYSQDVTVKQHMFTVLATADYFITPNWNVIGKVGPAWVSQKSNLLSGNWSATFKDGSYKAHKVAPYINLGTAYHFDNSMSVGVSYGHLFGSKVKSMNDLTSSKKVLSSNSVQLNLGYTFPF